MPEEKEVKIKLHEKIPLAKVIERVESLGFKKTGEKMQADCYFDFANLSLNEKVHALRIREENKIPKCFEFKIMFYLPKRKQPWFVEEICAEFPITERKSIEEIFRLLGISEIPAKFPLSPESLEEILKENSIERMFSIEKHRTSFKKGRTMIEIDQVKGLGNFLEIESEQDAEKLLQSSGLAELGREIKFGYTSLYLQKFFKKDFTRLEKNYLQNPKWNVLESEMEFYDKISKES